MKAFVPNSQNYFKSALEEYKIIQNPTTFHKNVWHSIKKIYIMQAKRQEQVTKSQEEK